MKRIALILLAAMLLGACACGQKPPVQPETTAAAAEITEAAAFERPAGVPAALTDEEWDGALEMSLAVIALERALLEADLAQEEQKLALVDKFYRVLDTDAGEAARLLAQLEAMEDLPLYMDGAGERDVKMLQAKVDEDPALKGITMTQGLLEAITLATSAAPGKAKPLLAAYLGEGYSGESDAFAKALYCVAETVEGQG